MTSPNTDKEELREQLLDLKRPDKFETDVIEAKLDDLVALISDHDKALVREVLSELETEKLDMWYGQGTMQLENKVFEDAKRRFSALLRKRLGDG